MCWIIMQTRSNHVKSVDQQFDLGLSEHAHLNAGICCCTKSEQVRNAKWYVQASIALIPRRLWWTWLIDSETLDESSRGHFGFAGSSSFQPYGTCCDNFGSGLVEPGSQKLGLPVSLIECSHAYVSCVVPKTSESVRNSRFSASKTAPLLLVETNINKYSNRFCNFLISKLATSLTGSVKLANPVSRELAYLS